MMKLLKYLFIFCVCLMLSACRYKNNNAVCLKFSTWGSASEISILKPIIADFEKNNPNIKIELLHIPQNYFQKLHLLVASNLAPDVIFINNLNLPVYKDYLLAVSVNNKLYYPQAIDALSQDGGLYAVPRDVSNLVIYYNRDIFDKCALKYPNKNWTLDDLLNIAEIIKSKGYWGIGYEEDMYYVLPYIMSTGESINPSENVPTLKGTKIYKTLPNTVAPSTAQVGSKTVAQMFLEQKIGMHLSGRWMVPKYKESANFNWDVVNFPGVVPCDASGWAISKDSKYKNEALKFVEYLSSEENISKMTESGLIVPARKDVQFNDAPFIEAVNRSKTLPITPEYNKMMDKLNDTVFLNNP